MTRARSPRSCRNQAVVSRFGAELGRSAAKLVDSAAPPRGARAEVAHHDAGQPRRRARGKGSRSRPAGPSMRLPMLESPKWSPLILAAAEPLKHCRGAAATVYTGVE